MKYLLCSITLHLGLLLTWQWSCSAHEYGLVPGTPDESPVVSTFPVKLIALEDIQRATSPAAPPKRVDNPVPALNPSVDTSSERQPIRPAKVSAELARHEIISAGDLTRLPRPFTDIDLDIPELKRIHFAGKVELILLIETDGTVSEVTPAEESQITRIFTDLVAARFKAAKFIPGEIDGKPVRSKLRITVVSEFVPLPEAKKKDAEPIDEHIP